MCPLTSCPPCVQDQGVNRWNASHAEVQHVRMLPVTLIASHTAAEQNVHRARASLCSAHVNHPAPDAAERVLDSTNPGCQLQLLSRAGTLQQRE